MFDIWPLDGTSLLQQSFQLASRQFLQVGVSTNVLPIDENIGNGALFRQLLQRGLDISTILCIDHQSVPLCDKRVTTTYAFDLVPKL